MECPNCKTETVWESDIDQEDLDGQSCIESSWSCPECDTFIVIYTPVEQTDGN